MRTKVCRRWLGQVAPLAPSVQLLREQILEPPHSLRNARIQVDQILSHPEFHHGVRPPSAWDIWIEHLNGWLARQIENLFRAAARHPATSQLVFWAAALAALGLIAFHLFRLWNNDGTSGRRNALHPQQESKTDASGWLRAAREAESAGDLRRAVQCLYWAAVTFLQGRKDLPASPVYTPRELLHSLRRPDALQPLETLTQAMERFWYAQQPVRAEDWQLCLQSVKALGWEQD